MKKLLISTVAIAALGVVMIQPSHSASVCGKREQLLNALNRDYKEAPIARALTASGNMLEIIASDKTGTFTVLITEPSGRTCVVEAGTSWQPLKIKKVLGPGA